jgi:hypothetical protein
VRIIAPASPISWAWILEAASGTSLCRRAAPARMALIGVRSSWLIMATKADLAATASSASWRRRSASSLAAASARRARSRVRAATNTETISSSTPNHRALARGALGLAARATNGAISR